MWNDLKYLIAYLSPAAAALGFYYAGFWSPGAVYLGFVIIPLIELVVPARTANLPETTDQSRSANRYFDVLLYLHVPIVYGLLCLFAWRTTSTVLSWWEIAGMTLSLGIILGTNGINVAHELGHRPGDLHAWMARLLLVPSFYTHFTIEHNYGHHRNVGTPEDPATARRDEWLYAFWWRSTAGLFLNAWKLERKRLLESGKNPWSIANQLVQGMLLQVLYITIAFWYGGLQLVLLFIAAGIVGFLLLETVNYIEHYGLARRVLPSGQYEPVQAMHSWNSNHELGRIFLYELVRHADHHYRTNRKYQVLRHLEGAPQLPTGYPGSMLMALVPPLWKKLTHARLSTVRSWQLAVGSHV